MDRELVKRIRNNKGMNQYQFSNFIGISRAMLAQIEAGYRPVCRSVEEKIYNAVGNEFINKVRALMP